MKLLDAVRQILGYTGAPDASPSSLVEAQAAYDPDGNRAVPLAVAAYALIDPVSRNIKSISQVQEHPVATMANGAVDQHASNGSDTTATFRRRHILQTDVNGLRLVYSNTYGTGYERDMPNDISLRAGLELSDGTIIPVFFGGKRDVTIEPGGLAVSDVIGVALTKGDAIYSRTCPTVASGEYWPNNCTLFPDFGDGREVGVDKTTSGDISAAFAYGMTPVAVIGMPFERVPFIVLIGDSICDGQGADSGFPFLQQALGANNGEDFCYINFGCRGEHSISFIGNSYRRWRLTRGATHAIVEYGINDLTAGVNLATMQARLTAIWRRCADVGMSVYQTTITPRTDSTDSWATTGNQTAFSGESVRTQLNDWIRTTPAPLSGYFEVADTVETASNSGKWQVGKTDDGVHPNQTGHNAMATGVNSSVFKI